MSEINVGARLRSAFDSAQNTGDWAGGFLSVLNWLDSQGIATHEVREAYSFPVTDEVIDNLNLVIDGLGGVVHEIEGNEEIPEPEEEEEEEERPGLFSGFTSRSSKDDDEDAKVEAVG